MIHDRHDFLFMIQHDGINSLIKHKAGWYLDLLKVVLLTKIQCDGIAEAIVIRYRQNGIIAVDILCHDGRLFICE